MLKWSMNNKVKQHNLYTIQQLLKYNEHTYNK